MTFEASGTKKEKTKKTLEELNDLLNDHEANGEPGLFLGTLVMYLRQGAYAAPAAKNICTTLAERIQERYSQSPEWHEARTQRSKRGEYGMPELADALSEIGSSEKDVAAVLDALTSEREKCGVLEAKRLQRQLLQSQQRAS